MLRTIPSIDAVPVHSFGSRATELLRWLVSRDGRIVTMMTIVAGVSAIDLALTLTYATTIGMMEVNPLARAVMRLGSPLLVVLWKLVTAGFGIGTLLYFRKNRYAEVASWVCFIAMIMLLAHWLEFNHSVLSYADDIAVLSGGDFPCWVQMTAVASR